MSMPNRAALCVEPPLASDSDRSADRSDWRTQLPVLHGAGVTLRQLRASDAPSLLSMLGVEDVARCISPPPPTVEGFEGFIAWTLREQAAGRNMSFGVVPHPYECAIGIIQIRALEASFHTAEWGFAIGSPFWGTGVFLESASAVVEFLVSIVGVHRLEARALVSNGRGNAALRKLGAVQAGVLRQSFRRNGERLDQVLWAILDTEWRQARSVWGSRIH